MPQIVYYVATSLDGFIAGPNDDISLFSTAGKGVDQYLADLQTFQTVIMGRRTYEFGYQYGLIPGQPAYPHMQHHIFSERLKFDQVHPAVHIEPRDIERVKAIKASSPTDVYLCGGGTFAAWLLAHGLIDVLKVKINPIVLGSGIRLFGESTKTCSWDLQTSKPYPSGLLINTYTLR